MFYVSDTIEKRHLMIRSFYDKDHVCIAVLLASTDFEWTLRRAIVSLGIDPTADIRTVIKMYHKLIDYSNLWDKQVAKNNKIRNKKPWASVRLSVLISNWDFLTKEALPFRNQIIHGFNTSPGLDYARDRCEAILYASKSIVDFSLSHGVDLYKRLPTRRRTKPQLKSINKKLR